MYMYIYVKHTHKSYMSSKFLVTNWNGSKTQLDRDVDNERREERKRHFNADDEEMDKGRTKKVKNHTNRRSYEERSTIYNPFQEYQNKPCFDRRLLNRSSVNNSHNRRRFYNTTYARSRHGSYRQSYCNNNNKYRYRYT